MIYYIVKIKDKEKKKTFRSFSSFKLAKRFVRYRWLAYLGLSREETYSIHKVHEILKEKGRI